MSWSCLLPAVLIILVWTCVSSFTTASRNDSDRLALLAFKAHMSSDPVGTLASWNDSIHYCEWYGVSCSRHHRNRVTMLILESKNLGGTLSPHIGNLSFLHSLRLSMNEFSGPIPLEISRLFRLQYLYLNYNAFVGHIPANLTHCFNLREIDLRENMLVGGIPVGLTSLSKLTTLGLNRNELKGSIPPYLGNLSSLTQLSISYNVLTGNIPDNLCHIQSLKLFSIGSNNLSGTVPSCIYNLTKLTVLSLMDNQLDGMFPVDIGLTLPNLKGLYVASNKFRGFVPLSLSNASKLETLELGINQFTGKVPNNLGRLERLRYLSLHSSQMGSTSGDDFSFINSLTNCSKLETLSLANNFLGGSLPKSIANLSTQLTFLGLGENQIFGSIPVGIESLSNLSMLDLLHNYLIGKIPKSIGLFPKLQKLYLGINQFSGQIPDVLGNSTQLQVLSLSENSLHGPIPPSLENCPNLIVLDLSHNRLDGSITTKIISPSAIDLDFSNNWLSGHIPKTLGNCLMLTSLSMEANFLEGKIPQFLSTLKGIEHLDLSRNNFSGKIPKYLASLPYLIYLDLSENELEGPVPKEGVFRNATAVTVHGNGNLCGGIVELGLLPCPEKEKEVEKFSLEKVFIAMFFVSVSLGLLAFLLLCLQRTMLHAKPCSLSVVNHEYPRISYAELLKATNNFSVDRLIGVGAYGSVYKGFLAKTNKRVAVKVLNLTKRGASTCFFTECNALRNLRHRNLLRVITACSSMDFQGNDFKALVFEFMPNGTLDKWLHPGQYQSRNLNFIKRLNIAIDVASAVAYLHHNCQPIIVHCDLKPSNVLLDVDLTAHVADFGLASVFSMVSSYSSENQSSSLAIKGSIGYIAPEYGYGGEPSMQGDVYSYGILLLELFTGKRPTDNMFQDGENLHTFAKSISPEQVMNSFDQRMLIESGHEAINIDDQSDERVRLQECLVSTIKLGVSCSAESPKERMNMGEVLAQLYQIKEHYQGVGELLDRQIRQFLALKHAA